MKAKQMRLIGAYIFILVGVLIGCATTYLFSSNPLRMLPNIVLGIIGSFFGLFLRDIFDLTMGGKLTGALLAAVLGALVLTVVGNLFYNIMFRKDA